MLDAETGYEVGRILTPDIPGYWKWMALVDGTLYALGAHPFLLFQVARSLAVHKGMSMPDLLRQYRETVTPHGTPDYIT